MVAKKDEQTKSRHMTFTIDSEVYQRVRYKVEQEKAAGHEPNLSGKVSSFLLSWVDGKTPMEQGLPVPTPSDMEALISKLVAEKVSEAMRINTYQYAPAELVTVKKKIPEREDIPEVPGPIPTPRTIAPGQEQMVQESVLDLRLPHTKEERIILSDDMRKTLADRIKATGKRYPELTKTTGVGESALKKICNLKNPAKSLSSLEYAALMALPEV